MFQRNKEKGGSGLGLSPASTATTTGPTDSQRRKITVGLVGDDAVGKDSILHRFRDGTQKVEYSSIVAEHYTKTVRLRDFILDKDDYNDNNNNNNNSTTNPLKKKKMALDEEVDMMVWVVGGMDAYDTLRPGYYMLTDVVVLCYRVNRRNSFDRIKTKWLPDVSSYLPDTPKVILATQVDRREDEAALQKLQKVKENMVTTEEGRQLASDIDDGACEYMECSAAKEEGLKELFAEILMLALYPHKKPKRLSLPFLKKDK